MNLQTGLVLQKGKYTINSILGQGGFGITYRAIDHQFNQIVVLKTLNQSLRQHQDFAQFQRQFTSEVSILANSGHPNIARVWDCFEEDGLFFLVMDYIPGQSLAELINSGQNLHPKQAVHYIQQIASALSLVHKNGLLHRDIQPKNIIRRAGTNIVVLSDFGFACDLTPGIRQTHTNLFSLGYAAPEQCNPQKTLTPATDIYGLTATLYYLLTGKAPTPAPLRLSLAAPQTLKFFTKELNSLQPHLSPGIENIILRGLEIDAQKRPQTVEDWFAILLNESNILEEKPKNSSLREINSLVNNHQLVDIKSGQTVNHQQENYGTNKAKMQTVNKINIEANKFQVYTPSNREHKFAWINQLSLQVTIFLLFVFTAATFGWIGFDMALRYSYAKTNNKTASLTSANLLESLKKEQNQTFRNQDPSSPLFDSPSVKTYSTVPPELNKLPKPKIEENEVLPNSFSDYNQDNYLSEKTDDSVDLPTELPPYNYSSNDNENKIKIEQPETSYYPSEYQPKYPKYDYQKYQQQNQYPDNYY
ncbi:MAG: serine/threonine protein kinase [Trichodesmium sp.]